MKLEFQSEYDYLFKNAYKRLNRSLLIKLDAINFCQKNFHNQGKCQNIKNYG